MPSTPPVYQQRSPGDTVLYRIVRDHFETFRAQAARLRDGEDLPQFVEHAFRDFLRCGWLARRLRALLLLGLRIRSVGGVLVQGACAVPELRLGQEGEGRRAGRAAYPPSVLPDSMASSTFTIALTTASGASIGIK